jgi:hypothetical protein
MARNPVGYAGSPSADLEQAADAFPYQNAPGNLWQIVYCWAFTRSYPLSLGLLMFRPPGIVNVTPERKVLGPVKGPPSKEDRHGATCLLEGFAEALASCLPDRALSGVDAGGENAFSSKVTG